MERINVDNAHFLVRKREDNVPFSVRRGEYHMKNSKKSVLLILMALIISILTGCSEPVSENIAVWKDAGFKITTVTSQVREAIDLSHLTRKEFAHTGSAVLEDNYKDCALTCMNELTKKGGIYLNDYMYDNSTVNDYQFYQIVVFPWGFVELSQLSVADSMSVDYYELKKPEVTAKAMAEELIYEEVVVSAEGETGF